MFPYSKVEYLAMIGSDHRPLLATCEAGLNGGKRKICFDKRWVGKEGLPETIESGWNRTNNFLDTVICGQN